MSRIFKKMFQIKKKRQNKVQNLPNSGNVNQNDMLDIFGNSSFHSNFKTKSADKK